MNKNLSEKTQEFVPQVLNQVVNLSCYLCSPVKLHFISSFFTGLFEDIFVPLLGSTSQLLSFCVFILNCIFNFAIFGRNLPFKHFKLAVFKNLLAIFGPKL